MKCRECGESIKLKWFMMIYSRKGFTCENCKEGYKVSLLGVVLNIVLFVGLPTLAILTYLEFQLLSLETISTLIIGNVILYFYTRFFFQYFVKIN